MSRVRQLGLPWEDLRINVTSMGATQLPMTTIAMAWGFNVRVGMEDNVLFRRGEPLENNAQLVERAVRIATELDRPVATPEQARESLGLRGRQAGQAAERARGGALMKPPAFAYAAPTTVDEALELLGADGARVLAGGQSLVPLMSARREHPPALVDINRVAELAGLDANGGVTAGAVVRADRVARDAAVRARAAGAGRRRRARRPSRGPQPRHGRRQPRVRRPGQQPAGGGRRARRRADRAIRERQSARSPPRTSSAPRTRRRWSPASCCARSASRACRRARAARTTRSRARSRGWGLAGAAAALWLAEDGTIAGARVALGGVGETPVRVDADALIGAPPARLRGGRGRRPRGGRGAARGPARLARSTAATWPASSSSERCGPRAPAREEGRDGRGQ